jgi:hypothetical protein
METRAKAVIVFAVAMAILSGQEIVRATGGTRTRIGGVREKSHKATIAKPGMPEPDTTFRNKCRMMWAALTCLREAATACLSARQAKAGKVCL